MFQKKYKKTKKRKKKRTHKNKKVKKKERSRSTSKKKNKKKSKKQKNIYIKITPSLHFALLSKLRVRTVQSRLSFVEENVYVSYAPITSSYPKICRVLWTTYLQKVEITEEYDQKYHIPTRWGDNDLSKSFAKRSHRVGLCEVCVCECVCMCVSVCG